MTAPPELLLSRLDGVRQTGRDRWIARCPAHEDRRPSLSVRVAEGGALLLYDFGGCDVESIVGAIGIDLADLFPDRRNDVHDCRSPRRPGFDWRSWARYAERDLIFCTIALARIADGKQLAPGDIDVARAACMRLRSALDEVRDVA